MNISFIGADNKKYTFLHVPKVAGRSITAYIIKHSKSYTTHHKNTHATLAELKALNIDLGKTIAIFRNPYSRAVSLYNFLFKNNLEDFRAESLDYFNKAPDLDWFDNVRNQYPNIDFHSFCENIDNMPLKVHQHNFFPVDMPLHVERLSTDTIKLQKILGSSEELPFLNKGCDTDWIKFYNKTSAKLIYNYYRLDFKKLNYSKKLNNSSI